MRQGTLSAARTHYCPFPTSDKHLYLYAKHDDINNTEQQVTIPYIRTDLIDEKIDQFGGNDNSKLISYGKDVSITDIVTYKNLIAGKKYKISGTLLVKDTGKPLLNSKGKPYTASVEFAPENKDGFVKVVFGQPAQEGQKNIMDGPLTVNRGHADPVDHHPVFRPLFSFRSRIIPVPLPRFFLHGVPSRVPS